MKNHVSGTTLRAGLLGLALGATASTMAAPMVNLAGVQYVQYGDGQSYSLPFAIEDKCGGNKAGCSFAVQSSAGQISDLVVLATGTNNGPLNENFAGMDNAYRTPDGNGGAPFFRTDASTFLSTNGTVANNLVNTWDTSLSSLKTFLAGEQMVLFFNNNQINSGAGSLQSLAAWGQLWITDGANQVVGVYDFTNRGKSYDLFTAGNTGGVFMGDVSTYTSAGIGGPLAGDNSATDYVLSGGAICRNAGVPVACTQPHDEGPVAHNLGADDAAYAVLFPELTAQLNGLFGSLGNAALANYTLHVDVRLGCDPAVTDLALCTASPFGRELNNGYEQLFMGTAAQNRVVCSPTDPNCNTVPEPGSLGLAGVALLGLGAAGWRRRKGG